MKKKIALLTLTSLSLLASCGVQQASATYTDLTAESHYGKIVFEQTNGNLKEGDVLKFKVTPTDNFFIDYVTVNGEKIVGTNGEYSYALKAGANKVAAHYVVDKSVDWVSNFKLNIDDDTFYNVMNNPGVMDFRTHGVEQMATSYTDTIVDNLNKCEGESFMNYVDGDTTHVSTLHKNYTVKIRYLGIDTPESTSELEEWGKTASIYNKSVLSTAKRIILESQGWAAGLEDKAATADGNQRSLAYVWYSPLENPTKNDFRCLNLEMVYQGLSQGIGSPDDMGEDFYWTFDAANLSAQANKRHQYSGEADSNYFYYSKDNPPVKKTLKEVYAATTLADGKLVSPLFDVNESHNDCSKTLYQLEGYVTRKLDGAFYFQDQPSYTMPTDGSLPEAYGMYVFTYAQTPIDVGDYVKVIGVLSQYSGTLQMTGVSYREFNADPYRDIEIDTEKSVTADKIVPIELTQAQYDKASTDGSNLQHVLVKLKDDVYCNEDSTFTDGGIQECNRYNTAYPYYNDNNKLIFFGNLGSAKSGSTEVRLIQSDGVLKTYGTETSYSYKFYTGGTNNYNPAGADYVYPTVITKDNAETDEQKAAVATLITTTYSAKVCTITGIWGNYVSTSGKNSRDQITIVNPNDVVIKSTY